MDAVSDGLRDLVSLLEGVSVRLGVLDGVMLRDLERVGDGVGVLVRELLAPSVSDAVVVAVGLAVVVGDVVPVRDTVRVPVPVRVTLAVRVMVRVPVFVTVDDGVIDCVAVLERDAP